METLKDSLWVWGHDAGCHHRGNAKEVWRIPGENKLGPWEGAEYLGIPNCCRVVFAGSPTPPFDEESEKLTKFKKVVWSVVGDKSSERNDGGADDLDEVLRQAEKYPNVTGGILDDFFRQETGDARMTLERLKEISDRMHNAPRRLDLWLVYYAALFDTDYSEYLKLADVITFWSWNSKQLKEAEANLKRIAEMTPDKKHYAGCYLYNYGNACELTADEMHFQLDLYRRMWLEKKIDGIIVCSNTVADTGLEAVDIYRQWREKYGDLTR